MCFIGGVYVAAVMPSNVISEVTNLTPIHSNKVHAGICQARNYLEQTPIT